MTRDRAALDANVLYAYFLRDLLLSLFAEGFYEANGSIPPISRELNWGTESLQRQHQAFAQGRRRLFQLAQRRRMAGIFQPLSRGPGGFQRAGQFRQ